MIENDIMTNSIIYDRLSTGYGGRFYGVYPAIVVDINDPDGIGRIKVRLPWSPDNGKENYEAWARIAMPLAGQNRGTWFIPDVNDEVLIAFESGNVRHPYVIGSLWNGIDTPHESMDGAGENNIKSIKSRKNIKITFDDSNGQEKLTIETPGGRKVILADGENKIELSDMTGNSIKMESSGITIRTSAKMTINANMLEITSSMITVTSPMSKFSGIVQPDTVISNSIVSASYTPGAGNIW